MQRIRLPIYEIVFCHTHKQFHLSHGRQSRQQWLEPTLPERALHVNLIQYPQNICSARLKKFALWKNWIDSAQGMDFWRSFLYASMSLRVQEVMELIKFIVLSFPDL